MGTSMRTGFIAAAALLVAACGQAGDSNTQSDGAATSPASPPSEGASVETADPAPSNAEKKRPNFLIVVADDLGWSDVGAFGGEIRTPNIDGLAARGVQMTNFYVAPTCSPTRAMLMTGVDNHAAGLGTMAEARAPDQTNRNYAGQLHDGVVTMAEALKGQGYQTMMAGKWHLAVDRSQYPNNRGFDKSFALLAGGGSHFADRTTLYPVEHGHLRYVEDGALVGELPDDFYSSISYVDKLLDYLDDWDTDEPFLAYLAFTAPHDPLHVPDEWLDRYDGAYDLGPAAIRQQRAERIRAKGLFPENAALWQMPNFPESLPLHAAPWETRSEEQRETDTRSMEIYASMVELMDQQLGRVLTYLEDAGELENTYVVFFSDNGASAGAPLMYPGNNKEWLNANWDVSIENAGKPGSFPVMGREWANVSNTPWRLHKGSVAEGGIRSPLVVAGPSLSPAQIDALAHVTDITPTLYDLSGVDPAADVLFDSKLAPQGMSLLPALRGEEPQVRRSFATELFSGRAVREGDWKISYLPKSGGDEWQLFDMSVDPGETNDLASGHPEVVSRLVAAYEDYAAMNSVLPSARSPLGAQPLRNFYPHICDEACEESFERHATEIQRNAGAD